MSSRLRAPCSKPAPVRRRALSCGVDRRASWACRSGRRCGYSARWSRGRASSNWSHLVPRVQMTPTAWVAAGSAPHILGGGGEARVVEIPAIAILFGAASSSLGWRRTRRGTHQQLRAAFAGLEASARSIGPDRLVTRLGGVQKSGGFTVVATTGDTAHLRRVHEDGSEESVFVELTSECERMFGASVDAVTFVRR